MKFLIDAHLPKTLADFLSLKGFNTIHTTELPDGNRTTDHSILDILQNENRILISKDSDFLESYL